VADTAVVGAATLATRVLGFVRNVVVSALFGQSWKADVLNAVFNIPMNLRKMVAEGAFSTAFIPVLSKTLAEDSTGIRSRALVRGLFSLQLVVLLPLIVLAIVFAPQVVAVLAPFDTAEKRALAADLFRWFIVFLLLISWSAVLMGVENTHQKFVVPAISPLLFSIAVIASLWLLYPSMDVYAQIPGVLLGGLLPIILQWFSFRRLGYSMMPKIRFWSPDIKGMVKAWGPALAVSGISLVNQQVSMTLAATLHEGSVSALSNAIVFWQLPAGVLSASVITVFFPRMSRQFAAGEAQSASSTMIQGMELLALLLVPAGVFLALFSEPIIALALQRGLYTYADTVVAGHVLWWLSWGLFLSGAFNFLQRYFYARGDFQTPFAVSIVWALSDVAVSFTLMHTELGVAGLAAGSVAGFAAGALVLLVLAWRGLPWKRLAALAWFVLRVAVALVPAVWGFEELLSLTGPWWTGGMTWTSLGLLAAEGVGCVAVFAAAAALLGLRPWKLLRA
jgi:putative peptidoglycan lipid II flippase